MHDKPVRVFISHSSPEEGQKQRLLEIVKALKKGDDDAVEPLWDGDCAKAGERWRDGIDVMLAECDAAVVLLTKEALEASWVIKEATLLLARYEAEYDHTEKAPRFPVLPILDGVTPETVERHVLWYPLELTQIQAVRDLSDDDIVREIKRMAAEIRPRHRRTPLDRIADDIATLLSAKSHVPGLEDVLAALGAAAPLHIGDRRTKLTYAIAREMLRRPPPALTPIADALRRLGSTFPKDDAETIFRYLRPFWIDIDAAAWLLRARWRRPDCRHLGIVCQHPHDTLDDFAARADMPWRPPELVPLNGVTGGLTVDDVARELREETRKKFRRQRGRSDEEVDDFLRSAGHLVITMELPADEVVDELQRRYPDPIFLFHTSVEHPAPPGLVWVEPVLAADLEKRVRKDSDDAYSMFGL